MLSATGASKGIGIGKVLIIKEQDLSFEPKTIENIEEELQRYRNAVESFCKNTEKAVEKLKESASEKEADILMGHILMIKDPYMNGEIERLIKMNQCAESAVDTVCDMFITIFGSTDDELTKQRATDVADVRISLLCLLLGIEEKSIADVPKGTVIVAKDLTPSMTAGIKKENVEGIITETGGKTSHSAILARALEIPAVLSLESACKILSDGEQVIVDGTEGIVINNPDKKQLSEYTQKREIYLKEKEELNKYIGKETLTKDGIKVELVGNIGKPDDTDNVIDCDGEGVGLFRTEFLFMDRDTAPTEEEQFEAYKKSAIIMKEKPVIIRTLDIGGDKDIPYMHLEKEENPFLGFRAVRYCLKNRELYHTQLRALLRASAYGNIKIMVPLVTSLNELMEVKEMISKIKTELDKENISYNENIEVGVMIETPAASLIADVLAKEADFFSIGTNDLTGYTMCVDRGNKNVSYLYSPFEPAVLRSIEHIIKCAKAENTPVGMCGEAAADPMLIPLLISFGLNEYSVTPSSVLETRKNISNWSKAEADKIAQTVMSLKTKEEIIKHLSTVI